MLAVVVLDEVVKVFFSTFQVEAWSMWVAGVGWSADAC